MIETRRIHFVLTGTVCVALIGFCFGPAALAVSPEERPAGAGSATLQVTPGSVPESGGEVELLAIVRDDRGRPLENAKVNFLARTGTLGSRGSLVRTDAEGAATDRLTLTAPELAAIEDESFQLAVAVGSRGGSLVTSNVGVSIQRPPEAWFRVDRGNLIVAFDDESAGLVTSWSWDFGDGATSTRQSPSHTFPTPGHYVVTLRVGNSVGTDEVTRLVRVSGSQCAAE